MPEATTLASDRAPCTFDSTASGTPWRTRWLALGVLLAALVATALAYRPGLDGPLLLDDFDNLAPVAQYLEGRLEAHRVVFGNQSGPLGRPVAMASFLLDAVWFGNDSTAAKRTNLLIHLACGWLVFLLALRVLGRTPRATSNPQLLAALIAGLWLLMPIHVSSVLYLVQRMALLSAFFVLAGLLWYVVFRERIAQGRSGSLALWLGLPAFAALAALSKENGVLLLPLASLIEWCCFRPGAGERRPRSVLALHGLFVGIPTLVGLAVLTLRPEWLLAGYEGRHFTLGERLLTQPRVLWDYVRNVLLPHVPSLGLFHDAYPPSTGLLSPKSTLVAIAAWLAVIVAAIMLRARRPLFTFGVGFFLIGHAVESTVLPLEIYFEHRNYLPAVGLSFCVAAVILAIAERLPRTTRAFRVVGLVLSIAVPTVLGLATFGRAQVWSSETSLYLQELHFNGDSPRLRSMLASHAIQAGAFDEAIHHIEAAEVGYRGRHRMATALWMVAAHCTGDHPLDAALAGRLADAATEPVDFLAMIGLGLVQQLAADGRCTTVDLAGLADLLEPWAMRETLTASRQPVWQSRLQLARINAGIERFDRALPLAQSAFEGSGRNPYIGLLLFQLHMSHDGREAAATLLPELEAATGRGDRTYDAAVEGFRRALAGDTDRPSE